MSRMHRFAGVLALSVALVGCSATPVERPRVIVLFDLSGSTANRAVRARYLADFALVTRATAERGGSIYGELIGKNPTSDSATPIAVDFTPSPGFADNALYRRAEASKKVAVALAQARTVLKTKPQAGTDIFSGLMLAARLKGSGPTTLVVLSDMVETHAFNFYRADLDTTHTTAMIRALRASGRVPDLSGVRVYVAGAGINARGKVSAERNFAIQAFWTRYFAATGATLARHTARLVSFP